MKRRKEQKFDRMKQFMYRVHDISQHSKPYLLSLLQMSLHMQNRGHELKSRVSIITCLPNLGKLNFQVNNSFLGQARGDRRCRCVSSNLIYLLL